MRPFLIILFLLSFTFSYTQENSKEETDTSVIETRYSQELNSISIFNELKNGRKTYYTELYYDTRKVKEQGLFVDDNTAGIWKEFSPIGKLIREIDYGEGRIIFFDKKAFPFLALQQTFKLKGDSIIKAVYSKEFFDKHVTWNPAGSYIYNDTESGEWTDVFKEKPTLFLLRYNIKHEGRVYDDLIEFEINEKGEFVPDEYEEIYGFEQLLSTSSKTFQINRENALELARQKGLMETDSVKADAFLYWENFKSKSMYNGMFRFYVLIKTGSVSDIRPGGRSGITDKFDVYVFNPWTAAFVEKKKMKATRSWEEMSGSSTGLIPDN